MYKPTKEEKELKDDIVNLINDKLRLLNGNIKANEVIINVLYNLTLTYMQNIIKQAENPLYIVNESKRILENGFGQMIKETLQDLIEKNHKNGVNKWKKKEF